MTTREVADASGLTIRGVLYHIKKRHLRARRNRMGDFEVSEEAFGEWIAAPRKPGPKRGSRRRISTKGQSG